MLLTGAGKPGPPIRATTRAPHHNGLLRPPPSPPPSTQAGSASAPEPEPPVRVPEPEPPVRVPSPETLTGDKLVLARATAAAWKAWGGRS